MVHNNNMFITLNCDFNPNVQLLKKFSQPKLGVSANFLDNGTKPNKFNVVHCREFNFFGSLALRAKEFGANSLQFDTRV